MGLTMWKNIFHFTLGQQLISNYAQNRAIVFQRLQDMDTNMYCYRIQYINEGIIVTYYAEEAHKLFREGGT